MNLGKLIVGSLLVISSLSADIGSKGIVGKWQIDSLYENEKIIFNQIFKNKIEVEINEDGTISTDGETKHYIFDNNVLIIGNLKQGEIISGQIEEYELMDNVMERFAYGKKCFELKIKKIEDGMKSKNRMKICTEFKNNK